jgi:hypothetical protein
MNATMKFIITIDTEGDNQWDHGRELTVENIRFVPRFQELCEKYLIKPTYLVTSEVCEDSFARHIFNQYLTEDKAEIGAHLHSWTTHPFLDSDGYRQNDNNHAFATELPRDLLAEKIKNLTDQIEDSFGMRPVSFRSGRYGFDRNLAEILTENSYLVDSSVTPYVSWAEHPGIPGGKGGPDFIDNLPLPTMYNFDCGSLVEIPITILPTRFPLNKNKILARDYFKNVNDSLVLRGFRKLFYSTQPYWLRPTPDMDITRFSELLNEAINNRLPYIVMMFHSSELMPGCSRYRPDDESIEKLYELLEAFFAKLHDKEIGSFTLREAALDYRHKAGIQ